MVIVKECFLLIVLGCIHDALCQVIPGLSPSRPNRLLKRCMSQRSGNVTPIYNNPPANSVNTWCQTYSDALPCVKTYLPTASQSDPYDWYLSLVFDAEYANSSSAAVCDRLKKYGNKMSCLSQDINKAEMCVSMLTTPISSYLQQSHLVNQTGDTEENEKALRACLIPVSASRCFKPFFNNCRKAIRKLMARYFMILSGNCLKIAQKHQPITTKEPKIKEKYSESLRESTTRKPSTPVTIKRKYIQQTTETTIIQTSDSHFIDSDEQDGLQEAQNSIPHTDTSRVERPFQNRYPEENLHVQQTTPHARMRIIQRIITPISNQNIPWKPTSRQSEEIAEDIYIPDSQILSAMKPIPKNEIIKPNEEKEVESILSTYGNSSSSESDSSDESVIEESRSQSQTNNIEGNVALKANNATSNIKKQFRNRASDDDNIQETSDITKTLPEDESESSEESFLSISTSQPVTTTQLLSDSNQVTKVTNAPTTKQPQTGKSIKNKKSPKSNANTVYPHKIGFLTVVLLTFVFITT